MAVNNTGKTYPFMEFPLSIKRQDAFALDAASVFASMEEAEDYAANNPIAYIGQIICVVTDGEASQYQIKNETGDLEPLGGVGSDSIATDEEVEAMLDEVFTNKE